MDRPLASMDVDELTPGLTTEGNEHGDKRPDILIQTGQDPRSVGEMTVEAATGWTE